VTLYTDVEHHLLMEVQKSTVSQLELGVAERFTLTVQGMAVRDEQGKELLPQSSQALQVIPVRRDLIFDQPEQLPTGLMILDFSGQREPGSDWKLPLALVPRLKVFFLDATREDRGRRVSALQQLWIEPQLVPEEKKAQKISLQVQAHEVFTLHSVALAKDGLECELSGRTATIMVGKEMPPTNNVVPSWLEYLAKHVIFQTVCKPLGVC
jgi:hypothetical protein